MALFDKLFTKKIEYGLHEARKRDRPRQITLEQVRLLLFKECDWRGRKLLFDSSTVCQVLSGKDDKINVRLSEDAPCIVEVSEGFSYLYNGPAADASVLGEMIFGAVAINYKGVSLKIHIMDEPKRLMCTKVFCVPSRKMSKVERKTNETSNEITTPLNVPTVREEGVAFSFSLDRGDSGYYGDQSPYSSVGSTYDYFSMFNIWDGEENSPDDFFFHSPPGRKLSNSSNGSWQRRTFQNMATRFDLGHSPNLLSVPTFSTNITSCDSQVYSTSSTSGTSDSLDSAGSHVAPRKNKLGLALLITLTDSAEMDELRKCVEHCPQLQALVCRLRLATLAAGAGAGFVSTLYKAATDAAMWLTDLLYGPRLQPVWLGMVTGEARVANKIADSLLSDLCAVLSVGDTKHTNFFISTLLTHVLTYHLGWVTTVSPYDTLDIKQHQSNSRRPYNALWAQLGDLCGSIGYPPRAARTIISGTTNAQLINRLLAVLTYFVRSGDVTRTDFKYQKCKLKETKVISVIERPRCLKRTPTVNKIGLSSNSLLVPSVNQKSDSSVSTLVSETSIKRSTTLASLRKLSSSEFFETVSSTSQQTTSRLKRNSSKMLSLKASSDSSLNSSSEELEAERKVVFVLGEDEKLVGLKNKSNGGKSVKKSSKTLELPPEIQIQEKNQCDQTDRDRKSPTKCCAQTLQHSKPIKHSGFKFEFDKYPQIVTNYMKSKNLEILDRHYIGKPGNLKLDNFQFDPTIVPPIQEERCEICYKCQQMESLLQTPTNASEMEYMNDIPRQAEPQHAKETVAVERENHREMSPKTFVRKRKVNTVVVNLKPGKMPEIPSVSTEVKKLDTRRVEREREKEKLVQVKEVVEFPMPPLMVPERARLKSGFDASLLGGVTDHYVPDLILQGTLANPKLWELDLRRDLELTSYLNKSLETPIQAVGIIGDTNTWEVRVVGRDCGSSGMSPLVGGMLDALPAMWRAKVPAHQCLSFLEGKLREVCVLSKTLADMLMSTDLCDIATLTKSLNIDVNDVPLLLAVATTHTPEVASRYGISYR